MLLLWLLKMSSAAQQKWQSKPELTRTKGYKTFTNKFHIYVRTFCRTTCQGHGTQRHVSVVQLGAGTGAAARAGAEAGPEAVAVALKINVKLHLVGGRPPPTPTSLACVVGGRGLVKWAWP